MNSKTRCFTITLLISAIVVAGAMAVAGFAVTSEATPVVPNWDSRISLKGTATIYGPWACEGQAIVDAIPGEASEAVPGFPSGIQTTRVSVPVHGINCGNGTINKHLRSALKEQDHPEIYFQMNDYKLRDNGNEAIAVGELTIAGVTQPVELNIRFFPLDQGGVRIVGQFNIQMRDYSVKPPSFLFGIIKVSNDVTVSFNSALPPADEIGQASAFLETQ